VRLVHRDPVLHPVAERLEARLGVGREVVAASKESPLDHHGNAWLMHC
jgi:hypothetical protein